MLTACQHSEWMRDYLVWGRRIPYNPPLIFGDIWWVAGMYAVVRTGGKQYKVAKGDTLDVERLAADQGASIELAEVLMLVDGDKVTVGSPTVPGATVAAKILEHGRGEKIRIVKFRRRKHYRRQAGHRQDFTRVEITAIKS